MNTGELLLLLLLLLLHPNLHSFRKQVDFLDKRAEVKKLILQLEDLTKGPQEGVQKEVVVEAGAQKGLQEVLNEGLQEGGLQEGLQEVLQEEVQEQEEHGDIEVQEEIAAVDESLHVSENLFEIRFVKSKTHRNLGKIISGKQQFICNKRVKGKTEDGGSTYYYDCARKHEGKGQGTSCKAKAIIKTNDIGENVEVVKLAKLTDHNHICDQGRVLKWLLYEELEEKNSHRLNAKTK